MLARNGPMTRLEDALQALNLKGEVALSGRWVKVQGERCMIYVVEAAWGGGFYTWCDDPQERAAEMYLDPVEALRAGMRRAQQPRSDG